jgi:hypothetical protein
VVVVDLFLFLVLVRVLLTMTLWRRSWRRDVLTVYEASGSFLWNVYIYSIVGVVLYTWDTGIQTRDHTDVCGIEET